MIKRLAGRGRSDDNEETVKKRLRVNKRDAQPVVEYYDKLNKVRKISCDNTPEGTPSFLGWLLICVSCVREYYGKYSTYDPSMVWSVTVEVFADYLSLCLWIILAIY
jgi:hypothetical protein